MKNDEKQLARKREMIINFAKLLQSMCEDLGCSDCPFHTSDDGWGSFCELENPLMWSLEEYCE